MSRRRLAASRGLADVTRTTTGWRGAWWLASSPYRRRASRAKRSEHESTRIPVGLGRQYLARPGGGGVFRAGPAYDLVDDAGRQERYRRSHHAADRVSSRNINVTNDDVFESPSWFGPRSCRCWCRAARHVNPSSFDQRPLLGRWTPGARSGCPEQTYISSLNLDYMSFYTLVRLQNSDANQAAYRIVRTSARTRTPFSTWWMRGARRSERVPRCRNALAGSTNGCNGPNGRPMWNLSKTVAVLRH